MDVRMIASYFERLKKLGLLFIVTVIAPTICAIIYFGIFASDIYVSESQFLVRASDKQTPTGLGVLLKSSGLGSASEEISATESYAKSRDALQGLNKNRSIERAFSRTDISAFDRFNPLGRKSSFEDLYRYFQKHVEVEQITGSTITKLTVRAYNANDAYQINSRLLELSESLVNRLNQRSRSDLISFAENEVKEAGARATSAALALARYRNTQGVVDPDKQAVVQLQMVSKLQDELISTKSQLAELQAFAAQNSQVPVLNVRARELREQIDSELGKAAGDRKSFSSVVVEFQRKQMESQLADRQLAMAMASLADAKNEARRKQIYVERIVAPNKPDEATEPRRLRGIAATIILGLVAWGIFTMLIAGVREHNG